MGEGSEFGALRYCVRLDLGIVQGIKQSLNVGNIDIAAAKAQCTAQGHVLEHGHGHIVRDGFLIGFTT